MKKLQSFFRKGTSKEKSELLDLCELFGNKSVGVSSLSLGKLLCCNGIVNLEEFKKMSIDDISKLKGSGPRRIEIFIKMKEYIMEKDNEPRPYWASQN